MLVNPMFTGEGYKKIHARLSRLGIIVGKERLRLLMGAHQLLVHPKKPLNGTTRIHDGIIITDEPDKMYACDIKEWRCKEGKFYMFTVIEHFNDEVLSHLCATEAKTCQATEVLRMAVKKRFESLERDVCKNIQLSFRTDHGSQFISKEFEREISFLGITLSRAFVRSPECNGVVERYHRTIKEQLLHKIKDLSYKQAFEIIDQFVFNYNNFWLIHRLKLKSPIEYRQNKT